MPPGDAPAGRHLARTLLFLTDVVAGRSRAPCVPAAASNLGQLRRLRRPKVDVAATTDQEPALRQEMLNWCRAEQRPLILARVRAPIENIAELVLDVAFSEGPGAALLTNLQLAFFGDVPWLLSNPDEIHLRITEDGLVPTLTQPASARIRARAIFEADTRFSEFLWSG